MGIIKTAIMAGGGIYAVKQLAKSNERRHENSRSNNQCSNQDSSREAGGNMQNQGYWGPPGLPPRGPLQPGNHQNDYQRQWYSENNSSGNSLPRGYSPADYEQGDRQYRGEEYQYQTRDAPADPPAYYQQREDYVQHPRDNGGRHSLGGLADMAIQVAENGMESGKKGKKLDKGSKMMSELLGK